jgi:hypothetical protein
MEDIPKPKERTISFHDVPGLEPGPIFLFSNSQPTAPPHPQSLPLEGREAQNTSSSVWGLPPPGGEGTRVGGFRRAL